MSSLVRALMYAVSFNSYRVVLHNVLSMCTPRTFNGTDDRKSREDPNKSSKPADPSETIKWMYYYNHQQLSHTHIETIYTTTLTVDTPNFPVLSIASSTGSHNKLFFIVRIRRRKKKKKEEQQKIKGSLSKVSGCISTCCTRMNYVRKHELH